MAALSRRAHTLMSRKPITILEDAIDRFLDEKVSCPPVNDKLQGVLSWKDVLRLVRVQLR